LATRLVGVFAEEPDQNDERLYSYINGCGCLSGGGELCGTTGVATCEF